MRHSHIIIALTLAASLLASCKVHVIDTQEPGVWEYTLSIEDDATRSYIQTDHVIWEDNDKLGTFAVDASGALTTKNSYSVITPGNPATFKLYLSSQLTAGSVIYCYYPYDSSLGTAVKPDNVTVDIPAEQVQGMIHTLDNELPMASLPFEVSSTMAKGQNPTGGVYLCNLFSIIKFDIYSNDPEYAMEKIRSIKVTSDSGIAGKYTIDLTGIRADDESTLALKPSSTSNSVNLDVRNLSPGHRDGEGLEIWMAIAPGRHSGTIVITTDRAEYTATVKDADFSRSKARTIHIDLSSDKVVRLVEDGAVRLSWLDCYEVPGNDVSLSDGCLWHSRVKETASYSDASAYAYVFNPSDSRRRIVTHTFADKGKVVRNYTMLFDFDKRCALWVAYPMNKGIWYSSISRTDNWGYDPAVPEQYQPYLSSSYPSATYDRGHQLPSADRLTTYMANGETFYFTNMTPQNSSLNQGKWESLESSVRSVGNNCGSADTLYVVTGAWFDESFTTTTDRNGAKCAVPTGYYKCLMRCKFNSLGVMTSADGAAYAFENSASATRQDLSIDEVETLTGFDFFANVPASLQEAAESEKFRFFQ